ncbi:hypothetical protein AVEN_147280-1 [Araneus ventricosus]|uniref:Mariner Mos1 transposase n=1 Tax=Araneus ventricosus TaxID=182803 RepID=A0A4Y2LAU9_ARAVE|nr:hypothetical protein AVEN_147280-1 [Araneus ventricosus]
MAKSNIHGVKLILCIWWDQLDVVHYGLLQPKGIITRELYQQQLMQLSGALNSCGTVQLQIIAIDIDTLNPARRKRVDAFSVETAGSGKHPLSPSSDSLTLLGHPLCTIFAITKPFVDHVMQSSFAYRQFNSNFTCSDLKILPYELIHSRNRGHKVHLPRAWQVLYVYAPRLITLTPLEYGAP